ncbi:MAG: TlpA family protein disulfide reductase [Gammaproteobacteria bacterium]|nr:TlpA family protein disulfide reductase [Gammaproteobacteria bacterium]
MRHLLLIVSVLVLLPFQQPLSASEYPMAPPLEIAEWINGDAVTLEALQGKVVVIDFFQMWCPGCNRFSIPLVAHWEKLFADQIATGDLFILSIHTVFEGHEHQTTAKLKPYLVKKGIEHLVGVDRHLGDNDTPETMRRFRTRGTPEIAILDRQGRIRFQHFGGFDTDKGTQFLQLILAESRE